MVDAEQVVDAQCMADPFDPPGIAGLTVIRPVVQRVAPELAVGREIIRRAAGHAGKAAVRRQLEQRTAHPGVHRVGRDIDGDIAQDLDALGVGIGFQLLPLDGKLILQKLPEADLFLVLRAELGQCMAIPHPVRAGPLGPALHLVGGLQGHVQCIVLQPALVFQREGIVGIRVIVGAAVQPFALPAPGRVCRAQDLVAAGVQGAVVHLKRVFAPGFRLELGGGQQALRLEGVEVDEVRVARKGRAALVGAVPITGGAQRQDLPDLLARCGQKIHERFRFRSEAANSIGAGQAGHRH